MPDLTEKEIIEAELGVIEHLKLLKSKSPSHKVMVNALINLYEAEGEQFYELVDEELVKYY